MVRCPFQARCLWQIYTIDSVGSDSSDENGRGKRDNHNLTVRRTKPKIFDTIKLFEVPLSGTFNSPALYNDALAALHVAPRPITLFKSTSNRVFKYLLGITITVAARRGFHVRKQDRMMVIILTSLRVEMSGIL
jgi:hypothetical protein